MSRKSYIPDRGDLVWITLNPAAGHEQAGRRPAIALSQRVLNGGSQKLNDYLGFLKGGCSKFPLDLLPDAGVDMQTPTAVDTALKHFKKLVSELDEIV